MNKDEIKTYIRPLPLFSGLTEKDLDDIATIMEYKTFTENSVIIREGDVENRDIYVLYKGAAVAKIETQKEEDGANIHVLKEGDIFGELALILDTPRSATITATSTVEVFFAPEKLFERIAEYNNHLGMVVYRNLAAILAGRVVHSNKMLKHTIMWGW
jgi:CRP-like cAMP-binding protein